MADQPEFYVKFWGVRGSIACPGREYERYGGNTSCLEVRCGDHLLIFDAGTGLRRLGKHLAASSERAAGAENGPEAGIEGDLFLTHTHHDHIIGLPFFVPMFDPKNRIRIWAGHLVPNSSVHEVLCQFMEPPLFPVPPKIFGANVSYHDFTAGETLQPRPDIRLRTAPLNHPNGATGYRVDFNDKSICYITDTEHRDGPPDQNIADLVEGADIMIYDSSYTDDEYPKFAGWGHSTWQEGLRLCDHAGVRRLVIFHHDPGHDDNFMDGIAEQAERARPGSVVAREGLVLEP